MRGANVNTQVHAPRRSPAEPDGPLDLRAAGRELLDKAAGLRAGRSARTLTPGRGARLKQSLLALKAGERLQDHLAPGPTTVLGIQGTAVLHHADASVTVTAGVWTTCPTEAHSLEAVSDTVVLITVAREPDPEHSDEEKPPAAT